MSMLKKPSTLEVTQWGDRNDRPLLCTHGLNQNPQALSPLLKDMAALGFKPYLLHLPGHAGETDFSDLTAESYLQSFNDSYNYLKQEHESKIYFLGYSFGGLIGAYQFESCPFEKMVLIAPALELHRYTLLIKPFLPYISRVRSVALGNPEMESRYRYHEKGVPAEVYSSFFSIYSRYQKKENESLKEASVLMMAHPRDELVSHRKLRRWVARNTEWVFHSLDNREAKFRRYNHLCFDSNTLGNKSYQFLLKEIEKFLVD